MGTSGCSYIRIPNLLEVSFTKSDIIEYLISTAYYISLAVWSTRPLLTPFFNKYYSKTTLLCEIAQNVIYSTTPNLVIVASNHTMGAMTFLLLCSSLLGFGPFWSHM